MSPSLLQIVVLAIVQGAAELLPVSSSAHVIAAEKIMRLDPSSPEMTFLLAMLHTGTMAAMIVYFWESWKLSFFANPARFRAAVARVGAATGATLCVGVPLVLAVERVFLGGRPGSDVEQLFSNLPLVAASLGAAGAVILVAGLGSRSPEAAPAPSEPPGESLPIGPAIWIGAVQGICGPFRGLSRSGLTISAGMLLGVPRRVSEEFSFALAVVITPPVILRELLRFYRARAAEPGAVDFAALAMPGLLGMVFSFGAGLLALRWLSGWLEKGHWHYFGVYCFAAAAGVCALAGLGY
ncbi:MAG TPA: undecaprenyl-diphosphate phosphatase [Opitutaceae bacterium]|nr:undecaprenyl-diphosphate phosphatase [Opitutaceae bacterium]